MQRHHVPTQPPNLAGFKSSQTSEPTTIYISRIPDTMDEDALYDDFKDFGRVVATKVYRHRRGRTTGRLPTSGFVEFESRIVAEDVLTALNQDGYYKGVKTRVSWARRSLSESLSQVPQETYEVGMGKIFCDDMSTAACHQDGLPNHLVMREAQLWYKHVRDFYMQQEQMHIPQPLMYNAVVPTLGYAPAAVIHVHHHHQDNMQYYPYTIM